MTTKKVTKKRVTKNKLNAIIVLDRTGSMAPRWESAVDSVNEFVGALGKEVTPTITVAVFDSNANEPTFDLLRDHVSRKKWTDLNYDESYPRGMTPLYDSVAKAIDMALKDKVKATTIVVMTDGDENYSVEYNGPALKAKMDQCKKKKWEILFVGADINLEKYSQTLGLPMSKIINTSNATRGSTMVATATMATSYGAVGQSMNYTDDEKNVAKEGARD